jgi:hypothetical protein
MMGGAGWCSISLFKDSMKQTNNMRWYDRTIRFTGAFIMAAIAIGGSYLLASGRLFSK